MSELILRSQKCRTLIGDPSLPLHQRVPRGLQEFAGLELTTIADDVRSQLESDLAAVNQVLAEYELSTFEEYAHIDEGDLRQIVNLVDGATMRAITAEMDRMIASLDAAEDKLPAATFQEIREHRDLMIPALIAVLREAITLARAGTIREGQAHFFAPFLLSEFRSEEGFPVIVEAVSLPGEWPNDLFGDFITSVLARILAQFAGDRPEFLVGMIKNRDLNEFVRWEAAQSFVNLIRDGRLSRAEALAHLHQCLKLAIEQQDGNISGGLICVMASLAPVEAMEDIKEAFRQRLVDPFLISLKDVEVHIARGNAEVQRSLEHCPPTGISDTFEALSKWASFREEPEPPFRPIPAPRIPASLPAPPRPRPESFSKPQPVTRGERVSRNDPCPCGSRKKFKKCCGGRK